MSHEQDILSILKALKQTMSDVKDNQIRIINHQIKLEQMIFRIEKNHGAKLGMLADTSKQYKELLARIEAEITKHNANLLHRIFHAENQGENENENHTGD